MTVMEALRVCNGAVVLQTGEAGRYLAAALGNILVSLPCLPRPKQLPSAV